MNAKTNSGVFLQQPCSRDAAARSEAKGSKAVAVPSGCIYPSRSCSQVELPQCGCSRKLWFDIPKCEVFRWFDVQLESWYRSPRQVAVSVQGSRVFKHQQLNTTASPCCGPLFAVKNSTAHTSQLTSLLGLVWVSLAHLAITLLHGIPTHATIWWFHALLMARWCMFYTYQNSPIWLWRTAMQQKCM